jgi:hypothetical protein
LQERLLGGTFEASSLTTQEKAMKEARPFEGQTVFMLTFYVVIRLTTSKAKVRIHTHCREYPGRATFLWRHNPETNGTVFSDLVNVLPPHEYSQEPDMIARRKTAELFWEDMLLATFHREQVCFTHRTLDGIRLAAPKIARSFPRENSWLPNELKMEVAAVPPLDQRVK